MTRIGLASAFALALTAPASAASADGYHTVYGIGTKTCAAVQDWIQKNEISSYGYLDAYVAGYLTATNVMASGVDDIGGGLQPRQLMRKVLDYCDQNPGVTFQQAIADFVILRSSGRDSP